MQRIMCRKQANYRAGKYGDSQRSKPSDGALMPIDEPSTYVRRLKDVRSAARSKTVLWRCAVVQAMARAEEVAIVHVPDASNPADFLTKWLAATKVRASDEYARGVVHRGT